jgi:hypothetical protein
LACCHVSSGSLLLLSSSSCSSSNCLGNAWLEPPHTHPSLPPCIPLSCAYDLTHATFGTAFQPGKEASAWLAGPLLDQLSYQPPLCFALHCSGSCSPFLPSHLSRWLALQL